MPERSPGPRLKGAKGEESRTHIAGALRRMLTRPELGWCQVRVRAQAAAGNERKKKRALRAWLRRNRARRVAVRVRRR